MPAVGEELLDAASDPTATKEEHDGWTVGTRATVEDVQPQFTLRRRLIHHLVFPDLRRLTCDDVTTGWQNDRAAHGTYPK